MNPVLHFYRETGFFCSMLFLHWNDTNALVPCERTAAIVLGINQQLRHAFSVTEFLFIRKNVSPVYSWRPNSRRDMVKAVIC